MLSLEGASTQLYVRGVDLSRALGASLNRAYHLGRLGEVEALSDGAGATETAYTTDAWGNVLSGSAAGNPYVYQGGLGYWQEPDLELNYVRARWLDPAVGGWLSVDPVTGEPRCSYARNMPTTRVDPSGKQAESSEEVTGLVDFWAKLQAKYGRPGQIFLDMGALRQDFEDGYRHEAYKSYRWWVDRQSDLAGLTARTLSSVVVQILGSAFGGPLLPVALTAMSDPANRNQVAKVVPRELLRLLPPAPEQPEFLLWVAGFIWEVGFYILDFLNPVQIISAAYQLIRLIKSVVIVLFSPDGVDRLMWAARDWWQKQKEQFSALLWGGGGGHRGPYTLGKNAGTLFCVLLTAALMLVGGAAGLAKAAPALASALGAEGLAAFAAPRLVLATGGTVGAGGAIQGAAVALGGPGRVAALAGLAAYASTRISKAVGKSAVSSIPSEQPKPRFPDFLKEKLEAGNEFNRQNRKRYPFNEVEVEVDGKKYIVDSYDPYKREIISRRFTELNKIKRESYIRYFNEFRQKYNEGVMITGRQLNAKVIRNTPLTGDLVFEVPVQEGGVNQAIVDAAAERGIIIRDVKGKVY